MSQTTDNEFKHIIDLLIDLKSDLKETNKKIDNLNLEITDLKIDMATIKSKIES